MRTSPPPPDDPTTTNDGPLAESHLLDLVRLRSGQLQRCGVCVACYFRELSSHGEPLDRLRALGNWRSSPRFDEREKAAFALCEAIEGGADQGQVESALHEALRFFSTDELSQLVLCILAVSDLNDLCAA